MATTFCQACGFDGPGLSAEFIVTSPDAKRIGPGHSGMFEYLCRWCWRWYNKAIGYTPGMFGREVGR